MTGESITVCEHLRLLLETDAFPDAKPGREGMAVGYIMVSPFKTLTKIGIGEVAGAYKQRENGYTARPVKWLTTDLLHDVFTQDLFYSFAPS